jgi:branched-chain amino acid transport system permease protein
MRYWRYFVYAFAAIVVMIIPFYTGVYILNVTNLILFYITLALSWDILLRSGQISFGTAGFCGVGGYTAAILFIHTGMNPIYSILLGGLFAGILALLLGLIVLQLREMYFAIVTLALGGIFLVIVRNLPEFTGGPEGLALSSAIFGGDSTKTYWLVLALALSTIAVSIVFQKTRVHFAITSIRDDEIVARSSGINVFKYLVFLFVITSVIQGFAGGVFTHMYGFVSPEGSFSMDFILLPMAMTLLGGMYTTWGPVIGAILLGIISEYLKLQIPYGHLFVYGLIIVIAILFFPRGIVGTIESRLKNR